MKIWKKYASLFLTLVLGLSLAACGGNGDGSRGRKLRDTDVIIDYGMVTRGGEQTIVFAVCDQNAIYLYCDDDEHALFDTAMLPTEELYDRDIWNEDWVLGSMDFRDVQGLHAQGTDAFVAGHVQAQGIACGVAADKVADGCAHEFWPKARTTATRMAHSMRLRKRRQPGS